MTQMRIHLVRHGETEGHSTGYVGDPPLTSWGVEQAILTAARMSSIQQPDVFVSPMLRALQTAEPFVDAGRPLQVVDGLREIDLGDYPGDAAAGRTRPLMDFAGWNGEAGHDFADRVIRGFSELMQGLATGTKDIIMITHAGTINAILDHLQGIPHDGELHVLLSNCSISTLNVSGDTTAVVATNQVEHIPPNLRTP